MKKFLFYFFLLYSTISFSEIIKNDTNSTNSIENIIEISDINVVNSSFLDEHKIVNILTDDLVTGLLPYNIPFVSLDITESKLADCSKLIISYLIDSGFPYPKVRCDYNKEDRILNIVIDEGKKVKILDINVKSDFVDFKMCKNKNICVKIGDVFNKDIETSLVSNISGLLEEKGYIFNQISIEPIYHNDYELDLNIEIKKKKKIFIGKIIYDIEGDISPKIIENLLLFKEGDLFNYNRIRDSINNLKSKGVFSFIIISPLMNELDNNVLPIKIKVSVKEKVKKLKVSLGFDSFEGLKGSLDWTNYMYRGNMKKLGFKVEASKYIQNVETAFYYPFLFPEYKLNFYNNFGFQRENTEASQNQYVYDNLYLNRVFENFEISIGFNNIFNSPLDANVGNYDFIFSIYEKTKVSDINDVFFPTIGYKVETEIESSLIIGSFKFLELKLGLYGYYPLMEDEGLYLSGKMYIDNIKSDKNIVSIKRPLAGGYNSNRGYNFSSLSYIGDTNSITQIDSSIEIKKEIINNLYGFIFDDFTSFNEQHYNSVGLGAYYHSPLGVFSIGATYNSDSDYSFFFNVGIGF